MHGEHNEMGRLKAAIIREYEDKVGHFECFYELCTMNCINFST